MRTIVFLMLIVWGSSAWPQSVDDRYTLRVGQAPGLAGSQATVAVFYDAQTGSSGAAPEDIDGWFYGVCHDELDLTVLAVVDGATTAALSPDFNLIDEDPPLGQVVAAGFTVGVIIDSFGVQSLAPGLDYELNLVTYDIAATATGVLPLDFCDTLGVPAVQTVVVSLGSLIPLQVSGSISLLSDPEFVRGECNNDGSFDLADVIFLLGHLFPPSGMPSALPCVDACDSNNDGSTDLADAVASLAALFGNPTTPLPGSGSCEPDTGNDSLECTVYDGCP